MPERVTNGNKLDECLDHDIAIIIVIITTVNAVGGSVGSVSIICTLSLSLLQNGVVTCKY